MLRTLGRRSWARIGAQSITASPQALPNACVDGADLISKVGLGLRLGEQRSRTFLGGSDKGVSGSVKEAVGGWNSPLLSSTFRHTPGHLQFSQVRGFVQLRTNLEVADNSGARRVQCIKVMKGSNAAKIGDIIMASVKDAQPRGKVKKGEVVTCVVVRAATQKLRRDGSEIRFDKNAVVLVNKQGEPIGTRIFGPVPQELRRRKLVKILTLADNVV